MLFFLYILLEIQILLKQMIKKKNSETSFAAFDSEISVVDLLKTSQLVPSVTVEVPSSLRKSATLKVTDCSSVRLDGLKCSKGRGWWRTSLHLLYSLQLTLIIPVILCVAAPSQILILLFIFIFMAQL